jgi:hypothetical protein
MMLSKPLNKKFLKNTAAPTLQTRAGQAPDQMRSSRARPMVQTAPMNEALW